MAMTRRRRSEKSVFLLLGFTLLTGGCTLQDRFLYFPHKASVDAMISGPLRAWPAAGEFLGLLAEPAGAARGTVLVFHGNAGHAGNRKFYASFLVPLGFRVILAEYPGYGPREGPLGERNLVEDAVRTLARVHEDFGEPVLLIGESLGAAVAAAVAVRDGDKVAGLLMMTPWDRLTDVAAYHYPWLPIGLLLRDRYDSVANLAAFNRPVVVAVAERDDIVPERFGLRLYESLPGPKRFKRLHRAGHNDWILRVDSEWWSEIMDFLLDLHGEGEALL